MKRRNSLKEGLTNLPEDIIFKAKLDAMINKYKEKLIAKKKKLPNKNFSKQKQLIKYVAKKL